MLYGLGLVVVVPLVALLATSGLLASEIDDGSISYLLAKPVSRYTIVASQARRRPRLRARLRRACRCWWRGWSCSRSRRRWPSASRSASLLGGTAYCAIFALLSVLTRHAVVVGLIYLLIWEGLLGGLLDGIRWLSVTRWSAEVVDRSPTSSWSTTCRWPTRGRAGRRDRAAASGSTGRRLRAFNLTGDE